LEALVFPGESFVLIECPDNVDLCKRIKQQGGEPFYQGRVGGIS
jgi:hypothetical protein